MPSVCAAGRLSPEARLDLHPLQAALQRGRGDAAVLRVAGLLPRCPEQGGREVGQVVPYDPRSFLRYGAPSVVNLLDCARGEGIRFGQ